MKHRSDMTMTTQIKLMILCSEAKNKKIAIRTKWNQRTVGVIVSAEFHQWRKSKDSHEAQFKIKVGGNKLGIIHSFVVETLPLKGQNEQIEIESVDYIGKNDFVLT